VLFGDWDPEHAAIPQENLLHLVGSSRLRSVQLRRFANDGRDLHNGLVRDPALL
jgi:hypothetical protein